MKYTRFQVSCYCYLYKITINPINYLFSFSVEVRRWSSSSTKLSMSWKAPWSSIVCRQLKMACKLTEAHIRPNNFQTMCVSLATSLYSRRVAISLKEYREMPAKSNQESKIKNLFKGIFLREIMSNKILIFVIE